MKFLHCSDLHLGRKPAGSAFSRFSKERYEDYFRTFDDIVSYAISSKIDLFIIAGDLFDKRELSPDVLERSEKMIQKLKDKGINVIAIEGNHDRLFDFEDLSWLDHLKRENLLILLRPSVRDGKIFFDEWDGERGGMIKMGNLRFYGIGYQGVNNSEYVERLGELLDPSFENVVIVHSAIGGSSMGLMPGFSKIEEFIPLSKKCEYVAAGHAHEKKIYEIEGTKIFIPGAPEYWDLSENGEKGFFIYDTEDKTYTFIESKKRKKIERKIMLQNGSEGEFSAAFSMAVDENPVEKDSIYSITIEVPYGVFCNVNLAGVEQKLEELGALKGRVVTKWIGQDSNLPDSSDDLDIERQIISADPSLGKYAPEISKAIDKLKDLHRSGDTDQSSMVIDDLLDQIIGEDGI